MKAVKETTPAPPSVSLPEALIAKIDNIFIERSAVASPISARIFSSFPASKIHIVDGRPRSGEPGYLSARDFTIGKRNMFITPFHGQFFKRCPGAKPDLTCCNYYVLNPGLQCDMNCSYCYLQSYINTPWLTIYSNLDQALNELRQIAKSAGNCALRIGTGETMDSLSLDPLTLFSRDLIGFFRETPAWRLEFKTKSDYVDQFLDMEHAGNVIVSWSINPQNIVEREEHGTASLHHRLQAAQKCLARGYPIAFHIDPMIWHPEWRESYGKLVDLVNENFLPTDVPYISLGALRFQGEQRHMMRERFGFASLVNRAEMFPSQDGKWRYDRELRNEMFKFIIQKFREHSSQWRVFLCMETPESWIGTFATTAVQVPGLKPLFLQDPKVKSARLSSPRDSQIVCKIDSPQNQNSRPHLLESQQ